MGKIQLQRWRRGKLHYIWCSQFLPFLLLYGYRKNFHCGSGRDLWCDEVNRSTGEFPDGSRH